MRKDGTHWLTDEMRAFLSGRLEDDNKPFTTKEKWINAAKAMRVESLYYFEKIEKKIENQKE